MRKVLLIVVALAISIFGASTAASAHGDGTYPLRRPTVASSSSVVGPNKTFAVGAARFCPNKAITIILTKGSKHYAKTTRTNGSGQAVVWFKSSNIKPGTYRITAVQGHSCDKWATSTITIKAKGHDNNSSHSLGTSYAGSGIVSAFADLQAGIDARAAGVSVSAKAVSYHASDITQSPDSGRLDTTQLSVVALCGLIGLAGVETIRRRARAR
jgi:hypothetical protein